MSKLDWIRSTERFKRVSRAIGLVLFLIFVVVISHQVRLSEASALATKYASLINLALTVSLVGITGFYAWVTRYMALELTESRRASIRPLLAFDISQPVVSVRHPKDPGEWRELSVKLVIWNAGRGHAIQTRTHGSAPYETATERSGIRADISPDVPSLFGPGERHVCSWSIPLQTSFDEDRQNFFEIDATYEDTEGNIYQLLASYNLQVFSDFRYLRISEESLFFLPFHQCKALREPSAVNDTQRYVQLYQRKW